MKVELAQLAGRDNDTAYNLERTLAAIAGCAADTQLILFPEGHLMGFPSAESVAEVAEALDGPSVRAVIAAARQRNIAVAIGMAENDNGRFYNTTLLITPEGIALKYRKTHLWASDRGVYEAGDRYATRAGAIGGRTVDRHQRQHGPVRPDPPHRDHGPRPGKPGVCADGQPGGRG
jgi:(R)-amidase